MSDREIICARRNDRFRFLVFDVKMWLAWDFLNTTLPVPVVLNRFAADRFVFIFGMVFSSLHRFHQIFMA
jgi:hypothetical protein